MKSGSNFFRAGEHDVIELDIQPGTTNAHLGFQDGGAYLSISCLSKAQVLRIHQQASECLASWPERCVVGDCPDTACGTVRDPETGDDLAACATHRDDEPSEVAA